MDDDTARMLRRLLERRPVAALGTLHRGEPAVSMVPFVLPRGEKPIAVIDKPAVSSVVDES